MSVAQDLPIPDGGEPTSCPNGHPMQPGKVLLGWRPCGCGPALAHHGGHDTSQCEQCRTELGETMIAYRPHCAERTASGQM